MERVIYRVFLFMLLMAFIVPVHSEARVKKVKVKISDVEFRGNRAYTDRKLCQIIISRKSSLLKRRWFYEKNAEEDRERLAGFYSGNGYLDVQVYYRKKERIKKNGKKYARIEFEIREGPLYNTGDLIISGNEHFDEKRLRALCIIMPEKPFMKRSLTAAVASIIGLYAENGYIEADIKTDLDVDPVNNTVNIYIDINEHTRFLYGKTGIQGMVKTHPRVIKRDITWKEGDIINSSELIRVKENIYMTGLFDNVRISPVDPHDGAYNVKDMDITVLEKLSVEFGLSIGYDTIEEFWQQAEIYNRNFRGSGIKYGILAKRSEIRRRAELSMTEHRLWGSRWRGDMNIFSGISFEPGYTLRGNGGKVIIGRDFNGVLSLIFSYRAENDKYSDLKIIFNEVTESWRNDFSASTIYDTRDDLFNTLQGIYLEQTNEYSITERDVMTMIFRARKYIPVSGRISLATAGDLSFIISEAGIEDINPGQRLYAGGPNSVRGFKYNMIGPASEEGAPLGGKVRFVWNIAEFRLMFTKYAGVAVFYDMGNIWEDYKKVNLLSLRSSPGAGVRIVTPLGVFRLEYAVNTNPEKKEEKDVMYFGAGLAF
ncbi:MAG: BamA/TamA family outer membrane protein [Elusimicrobia bacterium]|nr:BamA/TamA family outer membrane protein [Elusimicrobiota bacterium]